MSKYTTPPGQSASQERRHPPIKSIEDVIVFRLARLVALNERAGQRWSETLFNLSINEWRLLALVQANGPVRAGELAELMLMDKSQVSRLVKALSGKSLLASTPDREDARAVVVTLTLRGQMLYEEVIAEVLKRNERVLAPLSPREVKVFDEMLERLIAHNLKLLANPPAPQRS